jgi:hypothetical protein
LGAPRTLPEDAAKVMKVVLADEERGA